MTQANEIAQQQEVDDLPLWRDHLSHEVLLEALSRHGVDEEIFARLLSAYRGHAHKQRPRGITADFDEIFQSIGAGE
jgi:hypothetical protein